MAQQATQLCDVCFEDLPLTAAYYDRKRDTSTGFRTTCKMCRKQDAEDEMLEKKESAKSNKVIGMLDESLVERLEQYETRAGTRVPHVAELLESLTEIFGGPGGIAQHVMANYLASKPGSLTRVRIMSNIISLSKEATRDGSATKPVDLMTDEELEAMAIQHAEALMNRRRAIEKPDIPMIESHMVIDAVPVKTFGSGSADQPVVVPVDERKTVAKPVEKADIPKVKFQNPDFKMADSHEDL